MRSGAERERSRTDPLRKSDSSRRRSRRSIRLLARINLRHLLISGQARVPRALSRTGAAHERAQGERRRAAPFPVVRTRWHGQYAMTASKDVSRLSYPRASARNAEAGSPHPLLESNGNGRNQPAPWLGAGSAIACSGRTAAVRQGCASIGSSALTSLVADVGGRSRRFGAAAYCRGSPGVTAGVNLCAATGLRAVTCSMIAAQPPRPGNDPERPAQS